MVRRALRGGRALCQTNPCLAVDADAFIADLGAARASPSQPGYSSSLGVDACYFSIRCVGSWLRGDSIAEAEAYGHALASIDAALGSGRPPDRHLVSALLLMTTVQIFGTCSDGIGGVAAFATLAERLAPFAAGISPAIRFNATCIAKRALALCHSGNLVWPPAEAPVGKTRSRRDKGGLHT